MLEFFRALGGIVAATLVGFALIFSVEIFSNIVHPFPEDFNGTHEEICEQVARYPHWVLAAVVPMWAGAAFVSTWLAGRLGNRASSLVVGLLFVSALLFNISMLPYYIWFKIACLLAIPASVIAGHLRSSRSPSSPVKNGGSH